MSAEGRGESVERRKCECVRCVYVVWYGVYVCGGKGERKWREEEEM